MMARINCFVLRKVYIKLNLRSKTQQLSNRPSQLWTMKKTGVLKPGNRHIREADSRYEFRTILKSKIQCNILRLKSMQNSEILFF